MHSQNRLTIPIFNIKHSSFLNCLNTLRRPRLKYEIHILSRKYAGLYFNLLMPLR